MLAFIDRAYSLEVVTMKPSKRTSLLGSMFRTLGNWHANWVRSTELDRLEQSDLRRIASDVGVDAADLRSITAKGRDSAELLPRRLASLGIKPDEIARGGPAILRDMERVCTYCGSKQRCARDLDLIGPPWPSYCPNVDLLSELTEGRPSEK